MNLVVLPLEGVSQMLFWQYRDAMPFVWRLFRRSIAFRRFFTTSTSAFQSFSDFIHGDFSELDHNLSYPSGEGCLLGRAENLFGILAENGYATLGIQHGESRPGYVKDNYFGAWPKACGEFRWHCGYDGFYAECATFIEKAAALGKPFALYCADRAGTVEDDCPEKRESCLFHERFAKGLSLLDGTIGRILQTLESLSLLQNTLVVVYGPYGMDSWKHSVSFGKTRGIEPYADLCWTPFFLCLRDNREAVDVLASSIDIKATILGILFPGRAPGGAGGRFAGINLLSMERNIVFTQNLFALERENEGPAKGLVKSYAASDGDQRLIVSSDGGIAGEGGMELYHDAHDPENARNLLDFFELNQNGDMVAFGRPDIIHPHFTQSFKPHLVKSIITSYNLMRDLLRRLSKVKEEEALRHCAERNNALLFNEVHFNVKRRRR